MMQFTDSEDRKFDLALNCSVIKRVKGVLEWEKTKLVDGETKREPHSLNLSDVPIDDELQNKLSLDETFLFEVIYAICQPQCEKHGIDEDEFGNGLDGEHFELASKAFWGALLDFFRGHKQAILEAQLAARAEATKQIKELKGQGVERMAKWCREEVSRGLEKLGSTSGNSPAS